MKHGFSRMVATFADESTILIWKVTSLNLKMKTKNYSFLKCAANNDQDCNKTINDKIVKLQLEFFGAVATFWAINSFLQTHGGKIFA